MKRLLCHSDLFVVIAFFALGCTRLCSVDGPVRFDADEGLNLVKARLVADGFALYSEVWSDQPPLFTWALAGWWRLFGDSLAASRTLVLLCSAVLLFCTSRLVRLAASAGAEPDGPEARPRARLADIVAGLLAMGLLLGSRKYCKLSVSVMIGLPAISLAAISLWMLARAAASRRPGLPPAALALAAGAVFAASMQTKLFTFMLVPLAIALLTPRVRRALAGASPAPGGWLLAVAFATGFAALFAPLAILTFGGRVDQLITPHVSNHQPWSVRIAANAVQLVSYMLEDPSLLIAAGLGTYAAFARPNRAILVVLLALASSFSILLLASPTWSHHRILLYIPLAAAAGIGLADLLTHPAVDKPGRALGSLVTVMALAVGMGRIGLHAARARDTGALDPSLLAALEQQRGTTRWLLTDYPLYAHAAGLRIPPELAVLSAKRLVAAGGPVGIEPVFMDVLRNRRPELVLLARFPRELLLSPEVELHLQTHYELLIESKDDGSKDDGDQPMYLYRLKSTPASAPTPALLP